MACHHITTPGGGTAIVCGPRQPKKRCACGRTADLLCDWRVKGKRSGTCDAPICDRCTTKPAVDKDLCKPHAASWEAWKAHRGG